MATYSTVGQLIGRMIRLSGQVPGTGVQVYSTDVFLDMLNSTVEMVSRKYWWPHLMTWLDVSLDGSTGVPTADLTGVQDHSDIKAIYVNKDSDPLPYITDNQNPARYTGSYPLAYEALPLTDAVYLKRLIRVYPLSATGNLRIRARVMPQTLVADGDIVPMNADLVVFGSLWSFFEDEGDNPQQAGKYKSLFDVKFTEIVAAQATHRVPLGNQQGGGDSWQTGSDVISNNDLTGEY